MKHAAQAHRAIARRQGAGIDCRAGCEAEYRRWRSRFRVGTSRSAGAASWCRERAVDVGEARRGDAQSRAGRRPNLNSEAARTRMRRPAASP